MGFLAGAMNFEHGGGDDFGLDDIEGGGVNHHGGVDASETAAFEEEDFAAGVADFLGGRADDTDGEADFVSDFGAASAAPTAEAAMMSWPQAWPMPGRESYSAQMAM